MKNPKKESQLVGRILEQITNTLSLDSTHAKSEKYCAVIELNKGTKSDYKAWEFKIPNNYAGKKITLSGYIKTENVTDGFAG